MTWQNNDPHVRPHQDLRLPFVSERWKNKLLVEEASEASMVVEVVMLTTIVTSGRHELPKLNVNGVCYRSVTCPFISWTLPLSDFLYTFERIAPSVT